MRVGIQVKLLFLFELKKKFTNKKKRKVENVVVCIFVESISGPEVILREGLVSYPVHWTGR